MVYVSQLVPAGGAFARVTLNSDPARARASVRSWRSADSAPEDQLAHAQTAASERDSPPVTAARRSGRLCLCHFGASSLGVSRWLGEEERTRSLERPLFSQSVSQSVLVLRASDVSSRGFQQPGAPRACLRKFSQVCGGAGGEGGGGGVTPPPAQHVSELREEEEGKEGCWSRAKEPWGARGSCWPSRWASSSAGTRWVLPAAHVQLRRREEAKTVWKSSTFTAGRPKPRVSSPSDVTSFIPAGEELSSSSSVARKAQLTCDY